MRGYPIICADCRECVAQETHEKDGAQRDVCSLCALAYYGPPWSASEDTLASLSASESAREGV